MGVHHFQLRMTLWKMKDHAFLTEEVIKKANKESLLDETVSVRHEEDKSAENTASKCALKFDGIFVHLNVSQQESKQPVGVVHHLAILLVQRRRHGS